MINPIHAILTVAVSAAVTILLRFLPFLVFRGHRKTPAVVSYFRKVLPYATMAMLVVFCLKDLNLLPFPHGLPELISCTVIGLVLYRVLLPVGNKIFQLDIEPTEEEIRAAKLISAQKQ